MVLAAGIEGNEVGKPSVDFGRHSGFISWKYSLAASETAICETILSSLHALLKIVQRSESDHIDLLRALRLLNECHDLVSFV